MTPFVFDIETGPRPDATAWLPIVEPPSNYKDQAKIEAYLAEKRAAALERAALSSETGRVLCVGVLHHNEGPQFLYNDQEAELLRCTWAELELRSASDIFVTFNGSRFDWPFLVRRSYILGVPVPNWFPRDGRWKPRQHVDLMEWWQAGDRTENISLDRLARLCGLPGKTDTGAAFAAHWAADRDKAMAYLRKDLELTRDLYLRMATGLEREPASETPQVTPSAADVLEELKEALLQRFPGQTPEEKASRAEIIREVFGEPWPAVKDLPAEALASRLPALRARLGLVDTTPPAKPAEEADEIPMVTPSPAAAPTPQPAAPAASPDEPDVAEAFAAELRKGLQTDDNVRLAIGWMVRNKWITSQEATQPDPLLHVPQAKAEKALAAMPRFLTAIGVQGGAL